MYDVSGEAKTLAARILSQDRGRAAVLIERACLLLLADHGGPASIIYDWINDDDSHAWQAELDA